MYIRNLIEDSCGWNKRLWADAIEYVLGFCNHDKQQAKVLEIGAGAYSSISPVFIALGYDVTCSYYNVDDYDKIKQGQLSYVIEKYGLTFPKLIQLDAWKIDTKAYDIIILKSVMGGICRHNDYPSIARLISRLYNCLNTNGILVTIDNQANYIAKLMRQTIGAGANKWTYINRDKLGICLSAYSYQQKGFGLINFAKFNGIENKKETLNNYLCSSNSNLLKKFKHYAGSWSFIDF